MRPSTLGNWSSHVKGHRSYDKVFSVNLESRRGKEMGVEI